MSNSSENFKDSPIGRIPKDWDVATLASLFQIQTGATPLRIRHQSYFTGGTVPWVKTMDLNEGWMVDTDERITELALKECSVQLLPPKTVLIAMYGGWEQIGRTGILKDSATTNQAISSLVKTSPSVEPEFALRALQHGRIRWKGVAASTRKDPNITRHDVVKFLIPLPPPPEQRHIAKILDTVDETIALTSSLIAKLKQIKAGLLHDLLTRGLDENGELRDAIAHPELFKDSPLGSIPKNWDFVSIADITTDVTDGDHHTPARSDSGIFLLSARNVLNGRLALDDVDFVSEHEYQRMIRRCYPEPGDILISCSGTVGRVCEVPAGFRCVLVRSAALVKLDRIRCQSSFIEAVLQSNTVQAQILIEQLQAAQPNLFQGSIKRLSFPLPPFQEQERIAQILDTHNTRILLEEAYLNKLKLQKKGLMHDLLTGQIRVGAYCNTPLQL